MIIVEESKIPSVDTITDVPLDNLVEVYKVCQQLQELCEKENGLGISAVQAGVPWKLFLIRGDGTCPLVPEGKFGYFINCSYEAVTEAQQVISLEGCLSLRSPEGLLRSFQVTRHDLILICGKQLIIDNDYKLIDLNNTLSLNQQGIVFQHEIDHNFSRDKMIDKIGKEIFVWK